MPAPTGFQFANNVNTTLAAPITTPTQTTIVVTSTANIPALFLPGIVFALTLCDAATQSVFEVLYVTGRSGSTLTVLRGQEGTAATTWLANDFAFGSVTAGMLANFASLNNAVAALGSAANTIVVSAPSGNVNVDVNPAAVVTSLGSSDGSIGISNFGVGAVNLTNSGVKQLASGDGSISVSSPTGNVNVQWLPTSRPYGGSGITNPSGILLVSVPYQIIGASAILMEGYPPTGTYTVLLNQVTSNLAYGIAAFYVLNSNGSVVGAGFNIYYTIVTSNTTAL